MDDTYASLLRALLGILTLSGVLWGAVRYLIKYKIYEFRIRAHDHTEKRHTEVSERIMGIEGDIYDLDIRIQGAERRLENLEAGRDRDDGHSGAV